MARGKNTLNRCVNTGPYKHVPNTKVSSRKGAVVNQVVVSLLVCVEAVEVISAKEK